MARNRNVQIIFWVSKAEKSMIEEKNDAGGHDQSQRLSAPHRH